MDEIVKLLPFVLGQGGVTVVLAILCWALWDDNKRLRKIVEGGAKDTLDLLERVIKLVGRFNRIAGGDGDDE